MAGVTLNSLGSCCHRMSVAVVVVGGGGGGVRATLGGCTASAFRCSDSCSSSYSSLSVGSPGWTRGFPAQLHEHYEQLHGRCGRLLGGAIAGGLVWWHAAPTRLCALRIQLQRRVRLSRARLLSGACGAAARGGAYRYAAGRIHSVRRGAAVLGASGADARRPHRRAVCAVGERLLHCRVAVQRQRAVRPVRCAIRPRLRAQHQRIHPSGRLCLQRQLRQPHAAVPAVQRLDAHRRADRHRHREQLDAVGCERHPQYYRSERLGAGHRRGAGEERARSRRFNDIAESYAEAAALAATARTQPSVFYGTGYGDSFYFGSTYQASFITDANAYYVFGDHGEPLPSPLQALQEDVQQDNPLSLTSADAGRMLALAGANTSRFWLGFSVTTPPETTVAQRPEPHLRAGRAAARLGAQRPHSHLSPASAAQLHLPLLPTYAGQRDAVSAGDGRVTPPSRHPRQARVRSAARGAGGAGCRARGGAAGSGPADGHVCSRRVRLLSVTGQSSVERTGPAGTVIGAAPGGRRPRTRRPHRALGGGSVLAEFHRHRQCAVGLGRHSTTSAARPGRLLAECDGGGGSARLAIVCERLAVGILVGSVGRRHSRHRARHLFRHATAGHRAVLPGGGGALSEATPSAHRGCIEV
eukprot:ctg_144.g142